MKKKSLTLLVAATLASSVLFSSCIGSFGLSNKLLDWNRNIDSKFVNELVFVAFWIVPVYEISALADILVLNSIEFWSGSNPVADAGTVKTIETKDGTYAIETQKDGYTTGVPAMIGAMMFLKGLWKKPGVWNVEEFNPDPFMEQLNKQGLPWHEIIDGDLEV